MSEEIIFQGKGGFAVLSSKKVSGVEGALLKISNPNSKVNTVAPEAFAEINQALDQVENEKKFKFLVLYGGEGKIHAGADVNMFSGGLLENENPPNFAAVEDFLNKGTAIDLRIKKIGKEKRTVSIMFGERFGGSVEWPLFTEFCVASPETGISLSEATIGIIPGWNGILNVMLKSSVANGLFMGATGTRLNAAQMQEIGVVDRVTEPDKLMSMAIDLAVSNSAPAQSRRRLASEEELWKILGDRLNRKRYQALFDEVSRMKEQPGADPKELGKFIDKKLDEMGKPLAPLSVESAIGFVAKYGSRLNSKDMDLLKEMAFDEAGRCNALIRTHDRVKGINSVLKARENILNKIPLYERM